MRKFRRRRSGEMDPKSEKVSRPYRVASYEDTSSGERVKSEIRHSRSMSYTVDETKESRDWSEQS